MRDHQQVKDADIASGNESMSLMGLLSFGHVDMMGIPTLIFKNANKSYPILGLEDNVSSVEY